MPVTLLDSTSLQLVNDSVFDLTAVIYNANNVQLGRIPMKHTQHYNWHEETQTFSANSNRPYTPYKVVWECDTGSPYDYSQNKGKKKNEYKNEYGTCSNVAPGSMVRAVESTSGARTCVIKKGRKAKERDFKKGNQPDGFNRWSNDGGQTWTNDS